MRKKDAKENPSATIVPYCFSFALEKAKVGARKQGSREEKNKIATDKKVMS